VLLADFDIADFRGNRILLPLDFIDDIARWTPPEHLSGNKLTTEGDIWQWAMMSLELLTDKVPFFKTQLIVVLHGLQRGARTDKDDYDPFDDEIWSLLSACWDREPKLRPDIHKVVEQMGAISSRSSDHDTHMEVDL